MLDREYNDKIEEEILTYWFSQDPPEPIETKLDMSQPVIVKLESELDSLCVYRHKCGEKYTVIKDYYTYNLKTDRLEYLHSTEISASIPHKKP